jgi:type 1 glutamine amidotransferase
MQKPKTVPLNDYRGALPVTVSRSFVGSIVLALAGSVFCSPSVWAQKKVPNGAKVLLLTGGQRQHHGYRDQAFYLSGILEDTGRFEVTIVEDAAILETPAMAKYDLIIVNADRRDPEFKFTRSQQEALLAWVKAGHGYVSIHGADNAAPDWIPEWREMLGGVFSHVGLPDSKTRKGTFLIKIADTKDPITQGVSDFELKDELYYKLQMKTEIEPLATTEYEGSTWPVAWTRTYGKGRVFHTPLGHRDFGPGKDDPLHNPSLQKLVVQGIGWVAQGKSAVSPTPVKP